MVLKAILFDFDNTLMNIHTSSDIINFNPYLAEGSKSLNHLLDLCDSKGIHYGIASYGRRSIIAKVCEQFFPRITTIYTPASFRGFEDHTDMGDQKYNMIRRMAIKHSISLNDILLIDDDSRNKAGILMPFQLEYRGTGITNKHVQILCDLVRSL